MVVIDNYRKSWALRYLREARVELASAQEAPKMASTLIFNAMRRAQAAIYHSLGDPVLIESMIQQKASEENFVEEPILRCLVEIERSIQRVISVPSQPGERFMTVAENVVSIASEIVNLFADESED